MANTDFENQISLLMSFFKDWKEAVDERWQEAVNRSQTSHGCFTLFGDLGSSAFIKEAPTNPFLLGAILNPVDYFTGDNEGLMAGFLKRAEINLGYAVGENAVFLAIDPERRQLASLLPLLAKHLQEAGIPCGFMPSTTNLPPCASFPLDKITLPELQAKLTPLWEKYVLPHKRALLDQWLANP